MTDFPRSLIEFQRRFTDEAACVAYLFAARWPEGFVCPGCGEKAGFAFIDFFTAQIRNRNVTGRSPHLSVFDIGKALSVFLVYFDDLPKVFDTAVGSTQ